MATPLTERVRAFYFVLLSGLSFSNFAFFICLLYAVPKDELKTQDVVGRAQLVDNNQKLQR